LSLLLYTDSYRNIQLELFLPIAPGSYKHYRSSEPIIILVPFLFPRSPLYITIDHEAKSAGEDYEDEDQEYERWHHHFLCCCILETLLALDTRNTCPFSCEKPGKRPSWNSRSHVQRCECKDVWATTLS